MTDAELAELRRDAERYRFIRSGDYQPEEERDHLKTRHGWLLMEEELDAGVDALMARYPAQRT